MPGPYIIEDITLLHTLVNKDAVVDDADFGSPIQCVFLVKKYSDCGSASAWKQGQLVSEAVASCSANAQEGMERGTAIATFKDGKYPNHSAGNHACFFIEAQDDGSGFVVLEQHVKPFPDKIQMRLIKYKGKPKDGQVEADNGDCYSVIL
jgi:hypothetical protein